MHLAKLDAHLTYCSNIHPGESWQEVRDAILTNVPQVRAAVAPNEALGVGLRLSDRAVRELLEGDALEEFREALQRHKLYVFTINGFPYGPFHGTSVKEEVYRPDWSEPERERYTERLAEALERLLPVGMEGSISTVPGCYAERFVDDAPQAIADALLRQAAKLVLRARQRGVVITLALEPEPCCALETIEQTVAFFEQYIFAAKAVDRFAAMTSLSRPDAEAALRQHVGVCLDTCHAAVEFEDPRACVTMLLDAGIKIAKVQVTTGIQISDVDAAAIEALRSFADDVYLHQVVASGPPGLHRFSDLPQAFAAFAAGAVPTQQWRVHFHVPVFLLNLGRFNNTQAFLLEALDEVFTRGATKHLEVETYTWDVLPPQHRRDTVVDAIVSELRWVLDVARRDR